MDYCNQFAKEYYLQDTVWQYFTTIAQQLPIQINEEQFLIKEKIITLRMIIIDIILILMIIF